MSPAPFCLGGGATGLPRGAMAEIQLGEGDSVERALKVLRRKLVKEGLFTELKRRRHYLKPSAARTLKSAAARRRKRKKRRIPAWSY